MTPEEQLKKWVDGEAIHNIERSECCPDFSCCNGNMVEKPIREKFAKAYRENDHSTVNAMLMMFLSNAFPRSYVAGFKHT